MTSIKASFFGASWNVHINHIQHIKFFICAFIYKCANACILKEMLHLLHLVASSQKTFKTKRIKYIVRGLFFERFTTLSKTE